MKRAATALLLVAIAPAVTGCAARQKFLDRIRAEKVVPQTENEQAGDEQAGNVRAGRARAVVMQGAAASDDGVTLTRLKELPAPGADGGTPPMRPAARDKGGAVPPGMQFVYGSGEAVALDMQAYLGLNDLMFARSNAAQVGHVERSVVLAPGATLNNPSYLPCGDRPLAVILDVDETALLNLGYEGNEAKTGAPYSPDRWDRWEKTGAGAVVATPGAMEAKVVADASKVTFVFNSNRSAANAAATEKALNGAGLGPAVHGETLWLQGDDGGGSGKGARRRAIAKKYCVIAMVGDQLGDFSDLFNPPGATPAQRRALAGGKAIKTMWGHGWFVLPNPVYGTALKGGTDDVFPADKRWTETEGVK